MGEIVISSDICTELYFSIEYIDHEKICENFNYCTSQFMPLLVLKVKTWQLTYYKNILDPF